MSWYFDIDEGRLEDEITFGTYPGCGLSSGP